MSSLTFDPRGSVVTLPKRPLWEPTPTVNGRTWDTIEMPRSQMPSTPRRELPFVKKSRKPLLEATHTRYDTMTTAVMPGTTHTRYDTMTTTAVPQGTRGSRNYAAVAADCQGSWRQRMSQIFCYKNQASNSSR